MRTLATLIFIAFCAMNTPAEAFNAICFDDKNLSNLQTQSKRGALIYVWSPRMVYSVQQMTLAARAAATYGLDFVVVHDMRVPPSEVWSYKNKPHPESLNEQIKIEEQDLATPPFVSIAGNSQPLCAAALLKQDAQRHFPTAFIVTSLGVHRHAIVGAMPPASWHQSIEQRLQTP